MLQTLRGKQKYQVTNVGVQASKVILALGVYTAEILGTQIKILYQFCDNCKILSCTFHLKEDEMKIAMFAHFKEYHGNQNILRVYMVVGGRCLKIKDVCMDFEPYFKVHNLVSFILKASYLVK